MYIIFGKDNAESIMQDNKYIVLEVDTIRSSNEAEPITAYCVVEKVPLAELGATSAYVDWHKDLIADYKNRQWQQCLQTIDLLQGHFNGELDSFYDILKARIQNYLEHDPGPDWDGVYEPWRVKTVA